jgi:uncharacterized repeat protein (TIGR02543 family)
LKNKAFKRIVSWLLFLCMITGLFNQTTFVHADTTGVPDGYVTISFVDYGIREEGEDVDFPEQLGVIIPPTQVPFYEGENIAEVTVRLLEENGIEYDYTGKIEDSFYLSKIKGFQNDKYGYVESFGEFDSGAYSGWMISQNNWFINMSTSMFQVEDGDIIKWQNTCQLGADIGCDWNNASAEMTGINFKENYGVLSPEFDTSVENYTYTIPSSVSSICFEVLQENYWSVLTCKVGDNKYKPMQAIPVENGTVIELSCAFSEYAGNPPTDEDFITITIVTQGSTDIGESGDKNPQDTQEELVSEGEGLSDLLIFTGNKTTMEKSAILGKTNEEYPNRVVFDQKQTEYQIIGTDKSIGNFIRFAPVTAEQGATVTLYYGEGYSESKVQKAVSTVTTYEGTNNAKVITKPGENKFKIVVTPPSGSTKRETTYYFTYYCKPTLTGLTIKNQGTTLYYTPEFAYDTLSYSTDVSASSDELTISAEPSYENYTVRYNDSENENVSISDTNHIDVSVSIKIDEETTLSNTYTIELNKLDSYEATLELTNAKGSIQLYDEQGERLISQGNGLYTDLLQGKTYSYVATAYGCVAKTGTIEGTDSLENGKLVITLDKAQANDKELPNYDGDWINFRNNDENMGITNAATPYKEEKTSMKWAVKYGTGWAAAPTPPIIVDNYLYIAVGKNVIKLNKETGEQVAKSPDMQGNVGFALNPLTYAEGMIFVPIGSGRIQALRADTLDILWVSEKIGGQTLCPISYHNGYIYSGTWNSELKVGTYFALTVTDEDPTTSNEVKMCSWKLNHVGGFYWAGAYVTDNYLIVGSDDGNDEGTYVTTAVLYSVDPITGRVIDRITGIKGDIRSTVSYDAKTDRVYFSTKGGWFYSVQVNEDGTFKQDSVKYMETGGMSTGTPLVYNGRAYLGVAGKSQFSQTGHSYKVIDVETMTEIYSVEIPGYVQTSALLSTAYVEETGKVYIYVTYNYLPGGIYVLEDSEGQTKPNGYHLYIPTGKFSQYCICSLVCDKDGTIYYKNDSCYLMAIKKCDFKTQFYLNGGTLGVNENGQEIGFSESQMGEKLPQPTKENYIFDGWYANEDFTGTCYDTVVEELKGIRKLYANWLTRTEVVIKLINNISETVTIEDRAQIEEARKSYEELSDQEKKEVTNYNKLLEAEKALAEIVRVKVDKVTLNKEELILEVNQTAQLLATVLPAEALTRDLNWESSDPTIATVDETGKVVACKVGTATIKVTSVDQNKTAECKVTVKEKKVTKPGDEDTPIVVPPVMDIPVVVPPITEDSQNDDELVLDFVSNLKAKSIYYNKIVLSWDSVNKATGYEIYRYDDNTQTSELIATVENNQTTYTVKNLDEGAVYRFYVKAFARVEGKENVYGDASDIVLATTMLRKPSIKSIKASEKQVTINIDGIEGANGYKIYMATSKKGSYKYVGKVNNGENLQFVKDQLESGKTYYFKVLAYKNVNDILILSGYSDIKSGKTTKTITITQLKAGNKELTVYWNSVKSASGYEVYIATTKSGKYTKAATIKDGKKTDYTFKDLKKNKIYYVKVRSYQVKSGKKVYSKYSEVQSIKLK